MSPMNRKNFTTSADKTNSISASLVPLSSVLFKYLNFLLLYERPEEELKDDLKQKLIMKTSIV